MTDTQNTPMAEAFSLKDLVQYGNGAVVSRTLIKQPTGTMTLFAFDKGQELSEHTAPFDATVQVLEGEVELVIGEKSVRASENQTVIMPANIPHALKAVTRFKMLLTMIRS
ncbi:cupin domain-containing protein [candidate division KSB1 bacterium]|nr:MAG: cupin domain-containing protein [candidate division KSB1 bacterium]